MSLDQFGEEMLIAINEEDLWAAKGFGLIEGENLFYVHGVGINLDDFRYPANRAEKFDFGPGIRRGNPCNCMHSRIYPK